MKITLTVREAKKLMNVLSWVNSATQDSPEGREMLEDITMKIKIAMKSLPDSGDLELEIV